MTEPPLRAGEKTGGISFSGRLRPLLAFGGVFSGVALLMNILGGISLGLALLVMTTPTCSSSPAMVAPPSDARS